MANEQHLTILSRGVAIWNQWRQETYRQYEEAAQRLAQDDSSAQLLKPDGIPDLGEAILERSNFTGIDLRGANLRKAVLNDSCLINAELAEADLTEASLKRSDMTGSSMRRARLVRACLEGVNLTSAFLSRAVLREANLQGANLLAANFDRTSLQETNLRCAVLRRANLTDSNLLSADLREADLRGAHLEWCQLSKANLSGADLRLAGFTSAILEDTNFEDALLGETVFADVDLANAIGTDKCRHNGPSVIDHRALLRSGQLPLPFLRGIGLPDIWMEYAASFNDAIQYYSCFISYSTKDQIFAERIYSDLQNAGIRCWYARHDMKSGDKIWDTIDKAIRLRDRVILILSENSLASDWVEDEVSKAFAEERAREQAILVPIRIDDVVLLTSEPWAVKLRDQRHIGDFTIWRDVDLYRDGILRLIRDLTVEDRGS